MYSGPASEPNYEFLTGESVRGPFNITDVVETLWERKLPSGILVRRDDEADFRKLGRYADVERRLIQQYTHMKAESYRSKIARAEVFHADPNARTPPSYWVGNHPPTAEFFDLVSDPQLRTALEDVFRPPKKKKKLVIRSVSRVENGRVWRCYANCHARTMKEEDLQRDKASLPPEMDSLPADIKKTYDAKANEMLVWVGVTDHQAEEVAQNGLRSLDKCFLTDRPWKADESNLSGAGGTLIMVGCRILCGRIHTEKREFANKRAVLAGVMAHTLVVRHTGTNPWSSFYVTETQRIYPEYIVSYSRG